MPTLASDTLAPQEVHTVPEKESESPTTNQTRRLKMKDGSEQAFDFLIIDSPDKWQPASEFHSVYDMPIIGTPKKIRFHLQGVSLEEWESIELDHKVPEWDGEGLPNDEFNQRREQILNEKFAHVFEKALGKQLTGDTYAEKANRLKELNPGEVQALYLFTQNTACNYRDGHLLQSYMQAVANREDADSDIMEFSGFEEWKIATEAAYIFRMHRPFEDHMIEFPLKNITSEARSRIENECRDPDPPKKPKRDPKTKRLIPTETESDFQDENWLRKCRAVNQKKLVMYLDACLSFQIPGENQLKQYEWVSKRLMGDVVRLKDFIEQELCGYASRYNFFTRV